ncbi:MAG: hypothetical protein FJ184_06770 [Gammaproteobacteria bacterium]|nr:hypothetical protein [Gammaproteobacteria bacterium]
MTVKFGDQRLHWQYVEEVADMTAVALSSERHSEGQVYNAFGDCRSWREAAQILKQVKPQLDVKVENEFDTVLAGTVEDYQTVGFSRDYGADRQWPLEAGIRATLETYSKMAASGSLS